MLLSTLLHLIPTHSTEETHYNSISVTSQWASESHDQVWQAVNHRQPNVVAFWLLSYSCMCDYTTIYGNGSSILKANSDGIIIIISSCHISFQNVHSLCNWPFCNFSKVNFPQIISSMSILVRFLCLIECGDQGMNQDMAYMWSVWLGSKKLKESITIHHAW